MTERFYRMDIPGWKAREELDAAIDLSLALPPDSTIVEIGACAGRVTWHIARNTSPGTKVYAIDLWDGDLMFVGKGYRLDCTQENLVEYFHSFTGEQKNIEAVQGDSLTVPWERRIDLLFIDPDLGFGRSDNLFDHFERWISYLKPGGFIAGFNYFDSRPDVQRAVNRLAEHLNSPLLTENYSLWKIRKLGAPRE